MCKSEIFERIVGGSGRGDGNTPRANLVQVQERRARRRPLFAGAFSLASRIPCPCDFGPDELLAPARGEDDFSV